MSFIKESTLLSGINADPGSNRLIINDYSHGRDLIITVDEISSDGDVDYALVSVQLQVETCTDDLDCAVGVFGCISAICNATNYCEYTTLSDCCGNGICEKELGETCSTCPDDCRKPHHCNDLGYFDLPDKCTKVR